MKGWIAAAVLASLVVTSVGSFWFGTRWQRGRTAIDQLAQANAIVKAAQQQINDYGTTLHQSTVQFQRDADALRAIAEDYTHVHAQQQQFATTLGARLDQYLAAHPAVPACDLGPDGLKLWNDANQGAAAAQPGRVGAAAAGAEDRPLAVGAMPRAAAGLIWQIGRAAAQPPADHDAVPRLPGASGVLVDRGAQARAAGNRAAAAGAGIVGHSSTALMTATTATGDSW